MDARTVRRPDLALLLPNMGAGGVERISLNLVNELVARGYAVDLLLLGRTGVFLQQLRPEIRIYDFRSPRIRYSARPLVRYLKEQKPRATLACMWPLTVVAAVANRLAGSPTRMILAEHTTLSQPSRQATWLRRALVRTSVRLAYPLAAGVVSVSRGAARDLCRFAGLPPGLVQVIYNPVVGELPGPETGPAELAVPGWEASPVRLLTAGTLKESRDLPNLLQALRLLRQDLDARLLILGDGPLRADVEAQVRRLDLDEHVFLPGAVSNLLPYYRRAHVFALPSRFEGLPTVLIEALAAGLSVVSTDCPSGPREILAHGEFGRLVPVADPAALAAALRETLAWPRNPVDLRQRALDFSIRAGTDAYEALLWPSLGQRLPIEEQATPPLEAHE